MKLAIISTLPQSAYATREEKAWRHAERYGMTAEKFKAQHSRPTHLEQIVINANIHWQRIRLSELFQSWSTAILPPTPISEESSPPQSPAILSKYFPCPPTVQSQSF